MVMPKYEMQHAGRGGDVTCYNKTCTHPNISCLDRAAEAGGGGAVTAKAAP